MKYTYILALIFAICVVAALSESYDLYEEAYDFNEVSTEFDDFEDVPYEGSDDDMFEFLDQIQTQQQFLATFNPDEFEEDMLIADEIKSTDSFQLRRESALLMQHGMGLEEYDNLHSEALTNIVFLTDLLKIEYNPYTTTYDDIMYLIDVNVSRATEDIQSQALDIIAEIRPHAHLFAGRYSLLPAEDEDAVLQAIVHLDKAVNWLINKVKSNKCGFCLNIVGYVRKRACGAAGSAVCNLIVRAAGPFSGALKKWGCGSPLNFASKLGNMCSRGLKYLLRNTRASDRNICRAVQLPTLQWRTHSNAFYKITGRRVSFGRAC